MVVWIAILLRICGGLKTLFRHLQDSHIASHSTIFSHDPRSIRHFNVVGSIYANILLNISIFKARIEDETQTMPGFIATFIIVYLARLSRVKTYKYIHIHRVLPFYSWPQHTLVLSLIFWGGTCKLCLGTSWELQCL